MKFLYSIVIFFVAIAVSYGRPEIDLKRPYLSSPVIIDGKELGLLWLYPKHNGQKLLVEVVPLLRYLGPYLADKDAVNSFKKNKKNRFIESDQLEQLGMSVVFDDEQLLLRANIRPSIRTQSSVDISEESRSITIVPDQNAAFSGFANIYLNQPFSNLNESQESIERDPFLGTADTTINLLGVALVSGVDYTENSEQELLRKNTWAEYDFKGLKSRFSFGEIEYSSVGYIVEGEGLGASLSNVIALNPQTLSHGGESYSITLDRASTVEVMVNGTVVHRGRYPAGPLDLSNFPFVSGNNNVELKATDNYGKVKVINYNLLFDTNLLSAGGVEYSISQTAPFDVEEDGARNYKGSELAGASFLRYGVRSNYTTGVSTQYTNKFKLFGLENSVLLPLGTIETNLSGAKGNGREGIGSKFIFRTHEQLSGRTLPIHGRTALEYRSKGFRQYNQFIDGIRYSLAQSLGFRVSHSSSLGASVVFRSNYISSNDIEFRGDYRKSFQRVYSAGISTSQKFYQDNSDFRVAINFSWYPLKAQSSVVTTYDSQNKDTKVSLRGRGKIAGLRSNYITDIGQKNQGEYVDFDTQFSGPRGEFGAHYSYLDDEQGSTHQMNIDTRFSLAFADNSFAFGNAINDAFVIVKATPGSDEANIPIILGRSSTDSAITSFGPALVTEISPYQYRELSFDKSELPVKYLLEREHFSVFPSNKRGVKIETPLSITTSILTQISDTEGNILAYLAGDVIDQSGRPVGRFFSNRKGRVYLEHINPGKYLLKLDEDTYLPAEIEAALTDDGIHHHAGVKFIKREIK